MRTKVCFKRKYLNDLVLIIIATNHNAMRFQIRQWMHVIFRRFCARLLVMITLEMCLQLVQCGKRFGALITTIATISVVQIRHVN